MFLLISKGLKVDSVIHEVFQVSVELIERRSAFVSFVLSKGLEGRVYRRAGIVKEYLILLEGRENLCRFDVGLPTFGFHVIFLNSVKLH